MKSDTAHASTRTVLSLPVWGAWIEIMSNAISALAYTSLPVWGAWIEIQIVIVTINNICVAPRVGSVD